MRVQGHRNGHTSCHPYISQCPTWVTPVWTLHCRVLAHLSASEDMAALTGCSIDRRPTLRRYSVSATQKNHIIYCISHQINMVPLRLIEIDPAATHCLLFAG